MQLLVTPLSRAHFCNCLLSAAVFLLAVIQFSAIMQIIVCHYAICFVHQWNTSEGSQDR